MKKIILSMLIIISCIFVALSVTSCGDGDSVDSVTGIKYSHKDNTITWGAVSGVQDYTVKINDEQSVVVVGNAYEYDAAGKNFTVSIIANPSDDSKSASAEVKKSFTYLNKVHNIKMVDGNIEWDAVSDATQYEVYLNGSYVETVSQTKYEKLEANKNYNVVIIPSNPGNEHTGYYGEESNEFTGRIAAAPTLKFENKTTMIYWDEIDGAAGYRLTVSFNGQTTSETLGSDKTSYINPFVESGVYIIRVQTTSDKTRTDFYDSKYAEIQITRLPTVGDIKTDYPQEQANNTVYISFDDIEGAKGFEIKDGLITLSSKTKTTYEYTFNRSVDESNVELEVFTIGDGERVLDSYTGKKFTITKLATPKNIKVNNELIVWDAVNKNNGYRVVIDGQEYVADANQLELPTLKGGTHSISIAARGNGESVVASDFCTAVSLIKLEQPQNLRIENNILTWEAVQYCDSYEIRIDDYVQYISGSSSFVIDENYIGQNTTIKVKAISSADLIIDSQASETKALFRLNAPVNLKTTNDTVSWSKVPNATGYRVHFNNTIKYTSAENIAWADIPAGNYLIKVYAVGDGITYFNSTSSVEIVVEKLATPTVTISETEGYKWTSITGSNGYEILYEGQTIELNRNALSYLPSHTTTGEKTVQVRALGNGVDKASSAWTEFKHIVTAENQPSSFKVEKNGNVFTVTIDNALSNKTYLFKFDGTIKEGNGSQTNTISNAGSFSVSVATKGNGITTCDSAYTLSKSYTILNKISENDILFTEEDTDYFVVSWRNVTGATGYTLRIIKTRDDGTVENEIVTSKKPGETSNGIEMTGYKSVKVIIVANGDQEIVFDSAAVEKTFVK